ncbi:hypothetical protein LIA77_05724 [Sarocladium implicatum]|nr:hypothetical protein LIA77_05724 [Sarocladium implicatum]
MKRSTAGVLAAIPIKGSSWNAAPALEGTSTVLGESAGSATHLGPNDLQQGTMNEIRVRKIRSCSDLTLHSDSHRDLWAAIRMMPTTTSADHRSRVNDPSVSIER